MNLKISFWLFALAFLNIQAMELDSNDKQGVILARIKELIEQKNLINRHDNAAIFFEASAKGEKDLVELLLAIDIDINSQDPLTGNTALHNAVSDNNILMCEFLLDHGANQLTKNQRQESPFSIATEKGYGEIIKLMIEKSLVAMESLPIGGQQHKNNNEE